MSDEKHTLSADDFEAKRTSLRAVTTSDSKGAKGGAEDKALLANLEELYERLQGDLSAIFAELGENSDKALRHPPASAAEFAEKYSQGFYNLVDDADSKK